MMHDVIEELNHNADLAKLAGQPEKQYVYQEASSVLTNYATKKQIEDRRQKAKAAKRARKKNRK